MPASVDSPQSPRKSHALELFAGLPSRYDRVGALMSFGQDPRWRRALVDGIAAGPDQRVLDVATGTGMVAAELVRRSGCRVVGLDQSEDMLAGARARLAAIRRWPRASSWSAGEAEQLPFADGEFDALTFTYLLRYVDDRAATMRELARVVRPGGRIGMLEFGVPAGRAAADAVARVHARAGCRCSAAPFRRPGRRSGASWGRASSSSNASRARPARAVASGRDRATSASAG